MRRPLAPALTVLVPALLLLVGFAAPLRGRAPAPSPADDESPLAEHMEVISAGLKGLRRALRDEGQAEKCLVIVAEIEAAALEAKLLVPPMADKLPEGDRPKFTAEYRKTMCDLVTKMLALETALLDGDQEAITTAFQAVRGMEDSGHERFTEDG